MPETPTTGGPKKPGAFDANFQGQILNSQVVGKYRIDVYADKKVMVDTTNGQVVQSAPVNSQYGTAGQRSAVIGNDKARLAAQNFGGFGTQHRADAGVFTARPDMPFDWQDFSGRHAEWIDKEYQGGTSQFVRDIQDKVKTGADGTNPATAWFQNRVNEKMVQAGKQPYFLNSGQKNAYQLDQKFGINTYSVPSFVDPAAPAPTPEVAKAAPVDPALPDPLQASKPRPFDKGWWKQDVVNLAGAVTDHVNKYNPVLQQEHLVTPDYALLDPSRQIAASQEQFNEFRQTAENTSSGQVARANILGASGQSAAHIADIIGQYENQNIGISNAAQGAFAETRNRETDINTRLLDKYVSESAVGNQNYDNAMREKKYRMVDAFNQGTTNSQKQVQLEQIFPQVHVDRNNGHLDFKDGKDIRDEVGYATQSPDDMLKQQGAYYKKAYDMFISQGMDVESAQKLAQHQLGLVQPTDAKSKQAAARAMMQARGMHYGGELPALPTIGF